MMYDMTFKLMFATLLKRKKHKRGMLLLFFRNEVVFK